MKLYSRRTPPEKSNPRRFLFKRSYLWFLWLSLSLYLLSYSSTPSFLLRQPCRRPSKTYPSTGSVGSLKIYLYNLPPEFNRAWLSNPRCATHLFAAEVALHEALLHSSALTADHREADFFFVPVYVSCNFSTSNGFPSLRHARPLLSSAVDLIARDFPFWNRSNGADHIFVASHDFGACFHAMEEAAMADGILTDLKNSILLQTFGVSTPHACQAADHVLIPPYIRPEVGRFPPPETSARDIFVFFRGKVELHPKNVSGRFYSRKVRTEIWKRFGKTRRFYLRRHQFDGYLSEMARSVFCLCPRGWAPWSPRLVESVALGCVPVIIADGIRLPFPEAVPWPEISLTVPEREVGELEAVLDRVAATNLSAIQRRLWDPAVRRALLFHRGGVVAGDATWHVLRELEEKATRAHNILLRQQKRKNCIVPRILSSDSAMNCHQILLKSLAPPLAVTKLDYSGRSSISRLGMMKSNLRAPCDLRISAVMNASSSSSQRIGTSSLEVEEEKSDIYSNNMTQAMGAVLTYRHELGMNYNFIRPDLIVGSCLQTPSDVDELIGNGVRTIFCLQQDSDLVYFGVDIQAIAEYAKKCEKVEHIRAEIRDFDAFDMRMRLPAVVGKLHKAINCNGGVTYIHCTAGLGRAPAVALAYMYWVLGYKLNEAHDALQSKRACCPRLEAIRTATADILTGLSKMRIRLTWEGGNNTSVEFSGLDIGWGQKHPLTFNPSQGLWLLERDLPEGRYEYKYIVDGEWTINTHELTTSPNADGHVNNYIDVSSTDSDAESKAIRERVMAEDDLMQEERRIIREFLELNGE